MREDMLVFLEVLLTGGTGGRFMRGDDDIVMGGCQSDLIILVPINNHPYSSVIMMGALLHITCVCSNALMG